MTYISCINSFHYVKKKKKCDKHPEENPSNSVRWDGTFSLLLSVFSKFPPMCMYYLTIEKCITFKDRRFHITQILGISSPISYADLNYEKQS